MADENFNLSLNDQSVDNPGSLIPLTFSIFQTSYRICIGFRSVVIRNAG